MSRPMAPISNSSSIHTKNGAADPPPAKGESHIEHQILLRYVLWVKTDLNCRQEKFLTNNYY